jgi:hypothetical protein
MTRESGTTPTTQRQEETMVATHLVELGCLLSLSSAREQESECL